MAFTIPNESGSVVYVYGGDNRYPQAEPDKVDIDILVQAHNGEGVLSGCAVTAKSPESTSVAVASGSVQEADGNTATVAAGDVNCGAAHATLPRFDVVVANVNTGVKSVVNGTAAALPVFPSGAAVLGTRVVLAAVWRAAADDTISNGPPGAAGDICDKRAVVSDAIMDSNITPTEGFLRKTGAGAYTAHKSNLNAAANPTVNDDSNAGYSIGSHWIMTTTPFGVWECRNATVGAAQWIRLDGDVVGPAGATDNAFARFDTATGKLLQNSLVICDDLGNITGVLSLTITAGGELKTNLIKATSGSSIVVGVAGSAPLLALEAMDGVNEGGEFRLQGAGENAHWYIDNYAGALRWIRDLAGPGQVVHFNLTSSALDLVTQKPIQNVADPTNAQDAATKAYADTLISPYADHNARHEPGGADPMAVDAAAATGSLRTLGTGALQAAIGSHAHAYKISKSYIFEYPDAALGLDDLIPQNSIRVPAAGKHGTIVLGIAYARCEVVGAGVNTLLIETSTTLTGARATRGTINLGIDREAASADMAFTVSDGMYIWARCSAVGATAPQKVTVQIDALETVAT